MHELALVQGLLNTVIEQAELHNIKKIEKIKIILGEMTAALPEALQFSFEVLSRDTPAQGADLEIENQPLLLQCQECEHIFKPEMLKFTCPKCTGRKTEILKGREIFVEYFEGE